MDKLRLKATNQPAQGTADSIAWVSCLLAGSLDLAVTAVYGHGWKVVTAVPMSPSPSPSSSPSLPHSFLFCFSLFSPHLSPLIFIPASKGHVFYPHMPLVPVLLSPCPHALLSLCSWRELTLRWWPVPLLSEVVGVPHHRSHSRTALCAGGGRYHGPILHTGGQTPRLVTEVIGDEAGTQAQLFGPLGSHLCSVAQNFQCVCDLALSF